MNIRTVAAGIAHASIIAMACVDGILMVVLPRISLSTGTMYPEVSAVAVPYAVAAVLSCAAGMVALLGLWMLVSILAANGPAHRARQWGVVLCAGIAGSRLIIAAVSLHLLAGIGLGGPGVVLALVVSVPLGAASVSSLALLRRDPLSRRGEAP